MSKWESDQPTYDEYHLEPVDDLPTIDADVDDLKDLDVEEELAEIAENLRLPNWQELIRRGDHSEVVSKLLNHINQLLETMGTEKIPELGPELKHPKRVLIHQRVTYNDIEETSPFVNGYIDGLYQVGEAEDDYIVQTEYRNGKKDGLHLAFEDSKLILELPYVGDHKHGVVREWDKRGKMRVTYFLNDKEVSEEEYFKYPIEIREKVAYSSELIPDLSRMISEYLQPKGFDGR